MVASGPGCDREFAASLTRSQNPKAQRGYSRDHRPDCKRVVIGLVIGREGFPIAHAVLAGSTQDSKTLGRMVDLLKDRVGLREGSPVVVDRGVGPARRALRRKPRRALLCLPLCHYSSQPERYSRVRNLFASGMLAIFAAAESQSSLRPPTRSEMEARLTASQIGRASRKSP